MISIQQREYANGYFDAMTSNEMLDRGVRLFQLRNVEAISVRSIRAQIKRFDERALEPEVQASDRRAQLVKRLADAEVRKVEAEIAIEVYILEAADAIKAKRAMVAVAPV